MKRPLKTRFWFYKPDWDWDWHWILRQAWKPYLRGSDEFLWHTFGIGFAWTGRIIFAYKPCPIEGCFTEEELKGLKLGGFDPAHTWPVDSYGWDHSKSNLENAWEHPNLYPVPEEIYEDYPEEWDKYHAEHCDDRFNCPHLPGSKIN